MILTCVIAILAHCHSKASSDLQIKSQDFLTFGIKDKTCRAQGNVSIQNNTTSLHSDSAFIQLQQKDSLHHIQFFHASGHIRISIPEGVVTGKDAFYHADQKKMTIKEAVHFNGLDVKLWSNHLDLFFANTPEEKSNQPWVVQLVSIPHSVYFQSKDIMAKGKKGIYNHPQKKATVIGNINIWNENNYTTANRATIDLKKKYYFVEGNRVQSLISIQDNGDTNRKKNDPCGKKSL
jgi:lipopolysaccharide assembly outer membrane protein LptD (OstA)